MIKKCILPGAFTMLLLTACAHHERWGSEQSAAYGAVPTGKLLFPPIINALPPPDFKRLMDATLKTESYDICSPVSTGAHARTCPVEITVTFEGGKCVASARDMKVPAGVRIIWQVRGGGWDFTANGVDFKDPARAAGAFDGHSNASGAVFFWDVLPQPAPGSYGYSVHLKEQHGNRTCDFDPAIWV